MYKRLLLICCLLCIAGSVFASPQEELARTREELQASHAHQTKLSEADYTLQAEMKDMQERLVFAAAAMQKGEAELSVSEERLRILNEQLNEKKSSLALRQKSLASLVEAALRLSRTPPEAVVMMPGDSTQTMKAARALEMASGSIKQESESLRLQMQELAQLKARVESKQKDLAKQQAALQGQRQELMEKLAERKILQRKLGSDRKKESQHTAQLAKKAEDLKELMSALEREEKERQANEKAQKAAEEKPRSHADEKHEPPVARGAKGRLRSFAAARGHIRPPVAGRVTQNFGVAMGRNETSKGILIAARPQAEVTSPYDGEVVFSGTFMNYGQLVILRHSDDFHTLLAGLAKIEVEAGQFLLEGEPIGVIGEGNGKLYVELRKDNQPVDPAAWLSGMNNSR